MIKLSTKNTLQLAAIILIFFGTLCLASGLMINKDEAIRLGKYYPTLGQTDDFEQWKDIPPVADRWKQSKRALIGIVIITLGASLQIISILIEENI